MTNNLLENNQNLNKNESQDDDELNLGEVFSTLMENKWLIIFFTIVALMIGVSKAFLATPIYKADAMLQVKENPSSLSTLEPVAGLLDKKLPVQAEIEIIKSRMILGQVVKGLNLEIIAKPRYFPIIGKAIARRFQQKNKDKISAPLFDFNEYAWGGEQILVDTFDLPSSWVGRELVLIAGTKGKFQVFYNNKLYAKGEVGAIVSNTQDQPIFRLFVSVLKARPGTHFILQKQAEIRAINSLQQNLAILEKGRGTGILGFSMESASPDLAMQVLNKTANVYVRMNVEDKSAEAQKTLDFLHKQLPIIKEQLEIAVTVLNEYRLQKGSVDLTIETQSILNSVVETRTQITLFRQKRDELRQNFTASHPSVEAIDKQIFRLESQIRKHNKKIAELPETQQIILRLSRDVKVSEELYTSLLNSLQAIKISKAGTVGDVRIIDYAVLPTSPVKPKKAIIIAISILLGLIIGVVISFIRKALNQGVEDPDIIEKNLDVPVYATVPHSELQKKLNTQLMKNKQYADRPLILALENNEELSIESLRSLRTTLHFAFLEAKNNIIMITGPSPGVGKTFVSTNLAVVLANAGKKILLIDADLRKGFINKTMGIKRDNGLSELISGTISPDEAIHTLEAVNIDFIPTGAIPPNPSELLLHERFKELLEGIGQNYDHIIIDSPPILAVTDACIIGRMASATLMVIRAGEHPLKELQQSVKRLKQNNVDLKGIVFNDVKQTSSRYGYGYGYSKYVYQYSYKK